MINRIWFNNTSFLMNTLGVDRAALIDNLNATGIIGLGPHKDSGDGPHTCDLFIDILKNNGII